MKTPKVGDKIYIGNSFYISRGSDDVCGGVTEITSVKINERLGKDHPNGIFVTVKGIDGSSYNYKNLMEKQDELREQFGDQKAHRCPDVDTPWIEEGDIVNGEVYSGSPIW